MKKENQQGIHFKMPKSFHKEWKQELKKRGIMQTYQLNRLVERQLEEWRQEEEKK